METGWGRGQESLGAAARATTTTTNDNKNNDNMGKGASGSVIYIKSEEQFNELINAGKPVSFSLKPIGLGLPRSEKANTASRGELSFHEKTLTILPLVFPLPCHAGRHRLHRHLVRTLPAHCALLRGAQWQVPFRDFR